MRLQEGQNTNRGKQEEIGRLKQDHERHCARDLRQRGAEAACM